MRSKEVPGEDGGGEQMPSLSGRLKFVIIHNRMELPFGRSHKKMPICERLLHVANELYRTVVDLQTIPTFTNWCTVLSIPSHGFPTHPMETGDEERGLEGQRLQSRFLTTVCFSC